MIWGGIEDTLLLRATSIGRFFLILCTLKIDCDVDHLCASDIPNFFKQKISATRYVMICLHIICPFFVSTPVRLDIWRLAAQNLLQSHRRRSRPRIVCAPAMADAYATTMTTHDARQGEAMAGRTRIHEVPKFNAEAAWAWGPTWLGTSSHLVPIPPLQHRSLV